MGFEYAPWPLPANVRIAWSTRQSGYSSGVFSNNNVAKHVCDPQGVDQNRRLLRERLIGQPQILWLNQTHSVDVVAIDEIDTSLGQDGCFTNAELTACCVMTADCLPVYLWSSNGDWIASVHAGWRGLANGILQRALQRLPNGTRLQAGIGPAISQSKFEVGQDVVDAFESFPSAKSFFKPGRTEGKFWCDLPGLAKAQLTVLGVHQVFLSDRCTYSEENVFYSYRRDGLTGRMANLIWKT